ncbi:DUF4924 family protein [Saccharicrinis sp. FJH54]|uniref:DUF4924 family protein n=1 Tax=Saccharicrinis sp. FJH54 TaxID=3344665 RepID=UPI0035D47431
MLIAQQKRKENIAEYLIYMWQIEDQIRAFNFNIEAIQVNIVDKYDQPVEVKKQIRNWYENLILLMRNEGITASGHLQVTKNLILDLYNTHLYLLKTPKEIKYQTTFATARPDLELLKVKTKETNDIAAAFQFLYGTLLLRLQGKELSRDTVSSLKRISSLISLLAARHHRFERGEEEIDI